MSDLSLADSVPVAPPLPLTPAPVAVAGHPTTAAGAGLTLRECIARWHAAHPDFVRVLECVAPIPSYRRGSEMPRERRAAIGAGQLGIPTAEYLAHLDAGERWCCAHQRWHPAKEMVRRRAAPDGYDKVCKQAALRRRFADQARAAHQRRLEAAS